MALIRLDGQEARYAPHVLHSQWLMVGISLEYLKIRALTESLGEFVWEDERKD
jgi:hypothetical protein